MLIINYRMIINPVMQEDLEDYDTKEILLDNEGTKILCNFKKFAAVFGIFDIYSWKTCAFKINLFISIRNLLKQETGILFQTVISMKYRAIHPTVAIVNYLNLLQ